MDRRGRRAAVTPADSKLKNESQLYKARLAVQKEGLSRRELNLAWWESMPMSYADWEAEDRVPQERRQFQDIEEYLLARSPFLAHLFANREFSGRRVLDLGCGIGVLSCLLARKGALTTAVDITQQGVDLTRQNAGAQQVDVEVVRADAENLAFRDASFDFVLSWGVIHHSSSTEGALAEVARVLKPGGKGLVMVYHKSSIVYYLRGLWWLIVRGRLFRGETLDSVQDHFVDGYYHRHFRGPEMARCLRDVGLRPTRIVATQQDDPILPLLPPALDSFLKRKFGWYLVAEFERPA